jgi:hypothetical protein
VAPPGGDARLLLATCVAEQGSCLGIAGGAGCGVVTTTIEILNIMRHHSPYLSAASSARGCKAP